MVVAKVGKQKKLQSLGRSGIRKVSSLLLLLYYFLHHFVSYCCEEDNDECHHYLFLFLFSLFLLQIK